MELNSHDASNLFNGNIIFDESLLTKDAVFEKLFQETENPILDSLTEECLELICCTCFLMMKSQMKDQLTGGKYFAPNNETRSDLQNCPTASIVSERDFAQYDQKLAQKPTLSDIAVVGSLCLIIKKVVIGWIRSQNEKLKTLLKLLDTTCI